MYFKHEIYACIFVKTDIWKEIFGIPDNGWFFFFKRSRSHEYLEVFLIDLTIEIKVSCKGDCLNGVDLKF